MCGQIWNTDKREACATPGAGQFEIKAEQEMAFEDYKARLSMLLNKMTNQPEDVHELAEQVRETLNEMRAMGQPVPEDLKELERQLEAQFARAAKGRT